MRTALVLLLLLALASVGGSLLPQVPNSPERVARYLVDHPAWGEVFWRTGMFDVFGSWWFALITVLLFVSLVACLVPRSRALLRAMRQAPVQARELDGLRHVASFTAATDGATAVETARSVLRRRRFRVAVADDGRGLGADKGIAREAGSLLFHWAFVLLLLGVIVGKGFGFTGRATLAEGQTWADAAANYDPRSYRPGRFFTDGHSGAGIRLLSFEDGFRDSGVPMDFVSTVELLDPEGAVVRTEEVRVNHPVEFEGLRIFQYGFGWAPVITVRDGSGRVISEAPVIFGQGVAPEGVSQLAMPWSGFVKLPGLEPQVAVELELWPDSEAYLRSLETGEPQPMVIERAPFMRYTVWQGPLTDPSLARLDTRFMTRVDQGVVGAARTVDLPGATMTFSELRQYSVLQVSKDDGVGVVLGAAILVLVGLFPGLYVSRRKVWVRVSDDAAGARVQIGGFALQRKAQFEDEFTSIVDAVAASAGAARDQREMVRTR